MEFEEFKFLYDDYKNQIKNYPKLTTLLTSTEKSTKKLECISLYSLVEKRQLDLQIQEEKLYNDIKQLFRILYVFQGKKQIPYEQLAAVQQKLQKIKQTNMETYDLLAKQDELLGEQIQLAQYYLGDQDHQNEIKEVDQDEEFKDQNGNVLIASNKQGIPKTQAELNQQRYHQLKLQIDGIQKKIAKINNGKGKWLTTDHDDFVKIYNRCAGNAKKIVEEGVKFLGMTNTQIMDHLETYDQYVQLQKEKKIVTFEYKQLKFMEREEEMDREVAKKEEKELKVQEAKKLKIEEQVKKKELIKQFKQKKQIEKKKLLEQAEKERISKLKAPIPLPSEKKKQIVERNKKFIESRQEQFKIKAASLNKGLAPKKGSLSKK